MRNDPTTDSRAAVSGRALPLPPRAGQGSGPVVTAPPRHPARTHRGGGTVDPLVWLRCAAVAVLAIAAVSTGVAERTEAATVVTAENVAATATVASFGDPARALVTADRQPGPVVAPAVPVPPDVVAGTQRNVVSFNNCTANFLRNDQGAVLGIVGAAHCVKASDNVMRAGSTFDTGVATAIGRADIQIDGLADIFYVGMNGYAATDVRAQLRRNYVRAGVAGTPANSAAVMTGYPRHNNPQKGSVTLSLVVGGIVRWPNDPGDTIATFGNWNTRNQACSPGASGSGLYVNADGFGYVIVGVLVSRAEFEHVQTMPYSAAYGRELRQYFEGQLDRAITTDLLCGFAVPPPR